MRHGSRDLAEPPRRADAPASAGLLAGIGIVAALATSSCCVLPLALFAAGISGAWIGNLTALAPYQPVFAATALLCLGGGLFLVRRRPRAVDYDGDAVCAHPLRSRVIEGTLWGAAGLVALGMAFPYLFAQFT